MYRAICLGAGTMLNLNLYERESFGVGGAIWIGSMACAIPLMRRR